MCCRNIPAIVPDIGHGESNNLITFTIFHHVRFLVLTALPMMNLNKFICSWQLNDQTHCTLIWHLASEVSAEREREKEREIEKKRKGGGKERKKVKSNHLLENYKGRSDKEWWWEQNWTLAPRKLQNKFDISICKPNSTLGKGAEVLGKTVKSPRKLSLFNKRGFQLHCRDRTTNTNVEFCQPPQESQINGRVENVHLWLDEAMKQGMSHHSITDTPCKSATTSTFRVTLIRFLHHCPVMHYVFRNG